MLIYNNLKSIVNSIDPSLITDYVLTRKKIRNFYPYVWYFNELTIFFKKIEFRLIDVFNKYDVSSESNILTTDCNLKHYNYIYDNNIDYNYKEFTVFPLKCRFFDFVQKPGFRIINEAPIFFNQRSHTYDPILFQFIYNQIAYEFVNNYMYSQSNILDNFNNALDNFTNIFKNNFEDYFSLLPEDLSIFQYNNLELYTEYIDNLKTTYFDLSYVLLPYIILYVYYAYIQTYKDVNIIETNLYNDIADVFKLFLDNISSDVNEILISRFYIKEEQYQFLYVYHNLNSLLNGFQYDIIKDKVINCNLNIDQTTYNNLLSSISLPLFNDIDIEKCLLKSLIIGLFTQKIQKSEKAYTQDLNYIYVYLILLKMIDLIVNDMSLDLDLDPIDDYNYHFEINEQVIKGVVYKETSKYLDLIKQFYISELLFYRG